MGSPGNAKGKDRKRTETDFPDGGDLTCQFIFPFEFLKQRLPHLELEAGSY
jgi:hypothetical protein